jgi:hypothetical protein
MLVAGLAGGPRPPGLAAAAGHRVRLDRCCCGCRAGPIARKFATSQLARTLATLLGGGIPLVNAIEIAARSIGNRHMAARAGDVGAAGARGAVVGGGDARAGRFPDVAVKMVEVGESTGALQDMLNSLADFYDEEIETNLGRFVTLIEPALLVIMGIVIAGCCWRCTCRCSSCRRRSADRLGQGTRRAGAGLHATVRHDARVRRTDRCRIRRAPPSSTPAGRAVAVGARPRRRRRGTWPSATGSSSSTWSSSRSTTSCSGRSRPT